MAGIDGEWKRYAEASLQLFDILLQEDNPSVIIDSLARIVGETLHVSRSLIYDVSFAADEVREVSQWIDPACPQVTPLAPTYPLSLFRGAARAVQQSRDWIESHASAPHPLIVADGSAGLVHGDLGIKSLLWYPFLFRDDGFYLLAFNHVEAEHAWRPAEIEIMRAATRHVSMALVKISLIEERMRAEQAMYAAQKLESLGLLAGGIAHDFNNLMVGVNVNAELVSRGLPANSPLRERAEAILAAGQRAATLAGQLLAYAGKGSPEITSVFLEDVVEQARQLLRVSFPAITVHTSCDAREPIECNRAQLDQVVMNLLVNAAEATPGHAGAIHVHCTCEQLDGGERAAVLEVTDHGDGMTPGTIHRIFDPFFTTKGAGRGLGLSAVQGIVKQLGGEVRVRSVPGRGSTFTLRLPLRHGAGAVAPPTPAPAAPVAPLRVLAIDDDEMVLSAIRALFIDSGWSCTTALGGAAGLETYRRMRDEVDCVLLDLTMPGLSGRDVLRRLREIDRTLPVVVMSGYSDEAFQETDAHTRFIKKPFIPDELIAVLAATVRRS